MKKFFYRVQEGDTLLSVSSKFNVPVMKTLSENGLKSEISEGDVLFLQIPDRTYTVKLGEDVKSVAEKFGTTPCELKRKNALPYFFYGLVIEV